MPIPVNPASIANAGVYTPSGAAIPVNLCKSPSEGMKALSMQFDFVSKPAWLVSFPSGPGQLMSQIAALYIDNTKNNFGVNILFPDTGYQVRVEPSGSRMIPVITGVSATPNFYVILDDNGNTSATDIVNIIALNQFVPEFSSNELQNVLSFGYSSLFVPQPFFTQSDYFNDFTRSIVFADPFYQNLIFAQLWFLTSININSFARTTDNSTRVLQIALGFDTNGAGFLTFLTCQLLVTPQWQVNTLVAMSNMQFISPGPANLNGGSGWLQVQISQVAGTGDLLTPSNWFDGEIWYNLFGGILIN